MSNRPTGRDVFIQAIADELAGTPNANHPVQFRPTQINVISSCTLCCALVVNDDRDAHRDWHDAHVRVHDDILDEALRYKSPPTYGGLR